MTVLVYAEHDNAQLKAETSKLITAAMAMDSAVDLLVAGEGCSEVAAQAAKLSGVSKVIHVDDAAYKE